MDSKMKACVEHIYRAECYDKDGNLKWVEEFPNLQGRVVTRAWWQ